MLGLGCTKVVLNAYYPLKQRVAAAAALKMQLASRKTLGTAKKEKKAAIKTA